MWVGLIAGAKARSQNRPLKCQIRRFCDFRTLQNCNEKDVDFWAGIPYIVSMIKKGKIMRKPNAEYNFIDKHLPWAMFALWTFALGLVLGAMA